MMKVFNTRRIKINQALFKTVRNDRPPLDSRLKRGQAKFIITNRSF